MNESLLPRSQCQRSRAGSVFILSLLLGLFLCPLLGAADTTKKVYDIPRGDAATTLRQFVEQSGEQVVFLVEKVRGVSTNAVHGEYVARTALDQMLAGTELYALQDDKTNALVVNRAVGGVPKSTASPTADEVSGPAPRHRRLLQIRQRGAKMIAR